MNKAHGKTVSKLLAPEKSSNVKKCDSSFEFQNDSLFESLHDDLDKIEAEYFSQEKTCDIVLDETEKRAGKKHKSSVPTHDGETVRESGCDAPENMPVIRRRVSYGSLGRSKMCNVSSRKSRSIVAEQLSQKCISGLMLKEASSTVHQQMEISVNTENDLSSHTDDGAKSSMKVQNCEENKDIPKVDKFLKRNETVNHQLLTKNNESNVSPGLSEHGGLASYIKHTLMLNALSPNSAHVTSVDKSSAIENAIKKAQERSEAQSLDIGPFYGLPSHVKTLLKQHRGIDDLYMWQHECLTLPAVQNGQNLIYSLPTSGGKTLVAEILILRELLCKNKNAILVLPYISIVQEKVRALSPFAVDMDFMIEEYASSKGTFPPRKRRKRHSIYICTIEKANSLVNSLIENERINEIGLIVIDELHMLGDGSRGAILESLLTKVKFVASFIQIIGMSATLGNMKDLQQFLHCETYTHDFRPVPLKEYIKVGSSLMEFDPQCLDSETCFPVKRTLSYKYTPETQRQDPDFLVGLVSEVIPQHSCLVFCPTKKHCENVALLLSRLLPKHFVKHKWNEKKSLYKALLEESNGIVCPILSKTLAYGIAYHHSGLTSDERKLIEEGFLGGTLCCLACTSTLAAGVNLPAKRVIIRAPYIGRHFLTYSRYKQMVGRAGRAGLDTSGESILMLKAGHEELRVQELLNSGLETCTSSLFCDGGKGLKLLILTLIGLGITTSMEQLYAFVSETLFAVQQQNGGFDSTVSLKQALEALQKDHMVLLTPNESSLGTELKVTRLGRAVFKSGVDLDRAPSLFDDLQKGLDGLSLHSHLHLLYLVMPVDYVDIIPIIPDIFFEVYMGLSPEHKLVAELIGVPESYAVLLASGRSNLIKNIKVTHRFYLTLILFELWHQTSLWDVSKKFRQQRGVIQNFLVSAASFASCVNHFCEEFDEFWSYRDLLPNFTKQLSYCVSMELIPLMELPAVKRGRARQLYNAGFKTLIDIAKADLADLVRKVDHLPRRVANQIVSAAKMLLLEKAESLREEAEDVMCGLLTSVKVST